MSKKPRKADFNGVLHIGDIDIPCFVLEDGTRVISGRGMTKAIGMKGRGQGIQRISTHGTLKPFISKDLAMAMQGPIIFLGVGARETAGKQESIFLKYGPKCLWRDRMKCCQFAYPPAKAIGTGVDASKNVSYLRSLSAEMSCESLCVGASQTGSTEMPCSSRHAIRIPFR